VAERGDQTDDAIERIIRRITMLINVDARKSLFAVCAFLAFAATPVIAGGTYAVVHSFDCAKDGCNPIYPALLAQGTDGILYGTLESGTAASQDGTVISYSPGGSFSTLYKFGGDDGLGPNSGLTLGFDGLFYGTTTNGGVPRGGTMFRLSGAAVTVLHAFTDGADGAYPWAPPVQTMDGSLYGVTFNGTNPGTVFRRKPDGRFTIIATLPSKTQAPLVMATDGNFYGTTQYGGKYNAGTVFRLSPTGTLAIVHSFASSSEGSIPISPVVQAADGKFYGTTSTGGTSDQGIVYQLTSGGSFNILRNFHGTDGSNSTAGFVQASDNFLYSVMSAGGTRGTGTLYRINTTGSIFQVLHQFAAKTGIYPGSTPTQDTNGTIYGLTLKGGTNENSAVGVLYSYTNDLSPFITLQLWAGPEGTQVGILGQGFTAATGVEFGTVPASYTIVSDSYMTATVPAGASTAKVTVLEPGGNLSSLKKFKVT
jgi:uncharacterized repeat protein (TIGR03803 family)